MQRERAIENPDNADDELNVLLPEIAKLLNVSVSNLEHYPSDLRKLICQIYIDSYDSDDDSKRSALSQVISLNAEHMNAQTMRMRQDTVKQAAQQQNDKTSDKKYILTRRTIMNNARIISSGRRNYQEQEQSQDMIKETNN
ncbi:MAG: hypothetical protein ACI4RP_08060 [Acutalibacteraceae bacterium]